MMGWPITQAGQEWEVVAGRALAAQTEVGGEGGTKKKDVEE